MYLALKHLHVVCVALSIAGFVLRGIWKFSGSVWFSSRPTRVLPHVVDSVLLLAAVAMVVISGQYPFVVDWVTAKVIGLLIYIVFGAVALRHGGSLAVGVGAYVGALVVYAWIVSVALLKNPAGFLAYLGAH